MTPLLIVPPYYLNGIDTTSKDAVQKKKDRFYHIVRDTAETLKIFDYMDIYSDRRGLFADLTHLNSRVCFKT